MRIQLDFGAVLAEWPLLLTGIGWTLALTAAAVLVGTALGIACAWVRARGFGAELAPRWLQVVGRNRLLHRHGDQPRGLCHRDHPRRAGGHAQGADRSRSEPGTDPAANLYPRGAAPGAAKNLAQPCEPDRHRDAGLLGVRANLHAGA